MLPSYPSDSLQVSPPHCINFARVDNSVDFHVSHMGPGQNDNAAMIAADRLPPSIYYFDAQRTPSEAYSFGNNSVLNTNAQNLPEVLALLQSRRTEYHNFVTAVRRVLPAIKWVSVEASPNNGQHAQIRIWNLEEAERRHDLTLPLSEGGTGVGQVLAILYVVLRSSGNIIIIDEPNSFFAPTCRKGIDRNSQRGSNQPVHSINALSRKLSSPQILNDISCSGSRTRRPNWKLLLAPTCSERGKLWKSSAPQFIGCFRGG